MVNTKSNSTVGWRKKANSAQYGGAEWTKKVDHQNFATAEEAKKHAEKTECTFFFYCREAIRLSQALAFKAGDAIFFVGKPDYGSATSCDAYEREYPQRVSFVQGGSMSKTSERDKVAPRWIKKANRAQYKGADWSNEVKREKGLTPDTALKMANDNPAITFFFFCRESMQLEIVKGEMQDFTLGDAVFFSGKPWYGAAPQCDAYERSPVNYPIGTDDWYRNRWLTRWSSLLNAIMGAQSALKGAQDNTTKDNQDANKDEADLKPSFSTFIEKLIESQSSSVSVEPVVDGITTINEIIPNQLWLATDDAGQYWVERRKVSNSPEWQVIAPVIQDESGPDRWLSWGWDEQRETYHNGQITIRKTKQGNWQITLADVGFSGERGTSYTSYWFVYEKQDNGATTGDYGYYIYKGDYKYGYKAAKMQDCKKLIQDLAHFSTLISVNFYRLS